MYILTVNISQVVKDRADITIIIKHEVTWGYRLSYLDLTLVHSTGQDRG